MYFKVASALLWNFGSLSQTVPGWNTDVDTLLIIWRITFRETDLQLKIILLKLIKCSYVFNNFLELHHLLIFCRADSDIRPDLNIKKVLLANSVRQICLS